MTDTFPISFDSEPSPPSRQRRKSSRGLVTAVWILSFLLVVVLVLFFIAAGILDSGAQTLVSGSKAGSEVSSKLAMGTKQLDGGMDTLGHGLTQLSNGTQTYASLTQQAADGTQLLANGAQEAASKAGQLSSAISLANGGVQSLYSALTNGIPSQNIPSLLTASQLLQTGTTQATAGVQQLVAGYTGIAQATGTTGTITVGGQTVPALGSAAGSLNSSLTQSIVGQLSTLTSNVPGVTVVQLMDQAFAEGHITNPQAIEYCGAATHFAATAIYPGGPNYLAALPDAWVDTCTAATNAYIVQQGLAYINSNSTTAATLGGQLYTVMSTQMQPGTATLVSAVGTLNSQVGVLAGGMQELNNLTGVFQSGMNTLASGTQTLANGNQQIATGASGISSALDVANTGAGKLAEGTSLVNTGAEKLDEGMQYLQKITGQLHQGTDSVAPGRLGLPVGIAVVVILLIILAIWLIVRSRSRRFE